MKSLSKQLDELASYIQYKEKQESKISKTTVAWQLDHSLQVINKVSKTLISSESIDYKYSFNFLRTIFLFLGYFPRGRAKSPKSVLPQENVMEGDLVRRIGYARKNIEVIKALPANSNFPHPYFGRLNKKQSIRFLRTHTEHHLKIVRDIIRA